ncbi:Rnase Y domain-containing protein [Timonella sp. A28]|uniref:Rnase Y domain-containing protein n=1 Tax=Timonella sp. A28 TaxID=3442640 RepID=UPI003EB8AACD
MDWTESGFIVATLIIALIALVLVLAARRDARVIRESAELEAQRVRDEIAQARLSLTREQEELAAQRAMLTVRENETRELHAHVKELEKSTQEERDAFQNHTVEHNNRVRADLERLARMTGDEARTELFDEVKRAEESYLARMKHESAVKAQKHAEAESQRIIIDAMARLAVPTSNEQSVEIIELESADFKGRIIGKEGRNIKTFEALTGVDLLIDDDSLAVRISSFHAERRDIAVTALQGLLAGGVVNPARIEDEVEQAVANVEVRANEAGLDAASTVGVEGLAPEIIEALGRLRFRTSYQQNVLQHSVETALIAGLLADELGLDARFATRAGLLHDIGKALTPKQRGSHATLGAHLVRQAGESDRLVNAVAAHHRDEEPETLEAVLVQIADAISAARPGARREDAAQFTERMETLEAVVLEIPGVKNVFALAAGRQLRVAVEPQQVPEDALEELVAHIAQTVEKSTTYSGEIEVIVIREQRARAIAG